MRIDMNNYYKINWIKLLSRNYERELITIKIDELICFIKIKKSLIIRISNENSLHISA